jgi:hypothetical protein
LLVFNPARRDRLIPRSERPQRTGNVVLKNPLFYLLHKPVPSFPRFRLRRAHNLFQCPTYLPCSFAKKQIPKPSMLFDRTSGKTNNAHGVNGKYFQKSKKWAAEPFTAAALSAAVQFSSRNLVVSQLVAIPESPSAALPNNELSDRFAGAGNFFVFFLWRECSG